MERLPGFRDFFPSPLPQKGQGEFEARAYLFAAWRRVLAAYGFQEYDGPALEPLNLFTKKSGEEIVGQLYAFEDKGGRAVALRPEMTPTLARMIAAHERHYKKPVKWFSIPQLFRYERKQKGRLREHFQLNADLLGEAGATADAELIALMIDVLKALGLKAEDVVIRLSSRQAWQTFFREHSEAKGNEEYEFFQIVDKLERTANETSARQLEKIGISLDKVQRFIAEAQPTARLERIVEDLAARGLDAFVQIDYGVIRGLAYYTGVVFEAFDRQHKFRAIAGGGRYDQLVEQISDGKTSLPALGFGMGDVVLLELLRSLNLLPHWDASLDVFCIIPNETSRRVSLQIIQKLRNAGFRVEYSLAARKPEKQLRQAIERKASFAVFPVSEKTTAVRLKNLSSRSESTVSLDDCVETLRRQIPQQST